LMTRMMIDAVALDNPKKANYRALDRVDDGVVAGRFAIGNERLSHQYETRDKHSGIELLGAWVMMRMMVIRKQGKTKPMKVVG